MLHVSTVILIHISKAEVSRVNQVPIAVNSVTRIQVQLIHKYFGNKLKITKQCQKLIVKEIHRPRPLYTEQDPTNVINLGDQKKKDF